MTNNRDRYRDKYLTNHVAIQECANKILENLFNGIKDFPKDYGGGTIRSAFKLLIFEGLISRRNDFTINDRGTKHIETHGFLIYPIDIAKNPR